MKKKKTKKLRFNAPIGSLSKIEDNTFELQFNEDMLYPSILYPQEMYEQMFEVGIKSGKNEETYQPQHHGGGRRLVDSEDVENYQEEKERLKFEWMVTEHDRRVIRFQIKLENKEKIS